MIEPDKKEIYRYLGCRGSTPDETVLREVDSCLEELRANVTPRYIFRRFTVGRPLPAGLADGVPGEPEKTGPGGEPSSETASRPGEKEPPAPLYIAGMEIRSRDLSRNLRGCDSVYLMGATLGLGPDRLMARAAVNRISRAVILQAAAAAMIETWCDEVSRKMIGEAAALGLYCRPRFSPGYGDFPLEYQKDFAQILRLQKEIGVSLTQSLLMIPSKSVTAVVGLSRRDESCEIHGCEACARSASCAFSRAGAQDR